MQVLTALLTLAFSIIVAVSASSTGNDVNVAVGAIGIVAGIILLLSVRVGFYALFAMLVVMGIGFLNGGTTQTIPFMVAYALFAFMAYRIMKGREAEAQARQQEQERAERMDRYVRSQLGE